MMTAAMHHFLVCYSYSVSWPAPARSNSTKAVSTAHYYPAIATTHNCYYCHGRSQACSHSSDGHCRHAHASMAIHHLHSNLAQVYYSCYPIFVSFAICAQTCSNPHWPSANFDPFNATAIATFRKKNCCHQVPRRLH